MKILLIKVSSLGDVVHALPVLDYLASCPEKPTLDWLVEASFAPLLAAHPLINRVIPVDTRRWRRQPLLGARKLPAVWRQLRTAAYDLVIDLQGNSKSGMFTLAAGAPRRCGFDRRGVREWPNLLATNHRFRIADRGSTLHIVERNLQLAAAALPGGCHWPQQGPLTATPEARRGAENRLRQLGLAAASPLVVLHFGTTWETKRWSPDYERQLTRKLATELNAVPLLTWGNDAEHEAALRNRNSCPTAEIWPGGDLQTFIALLERADLVIGGDTGPIHLAAALGTPTVSLYRATDHRRNGPRGKRHVCLQSPRACSPCRRKSCDRNLACSVSIEPAAVLVAATRLLSPAAASGADEPAATEKQV